MCLDLHLDGMKYTQGRDVQLEGGIIEPTGVPTYVTNSAGIDLNAMWAASEGQPGNVAFELKNTHESMTETAVLQGDDLYTM